MTYEQAMVEVMGYVEHMGERIRNIEENTYSRDELIELLHSASHNGNEYNEHFACDADAQFFYNLIHLLTDPEWKPQKIPPKVKYPTRSRQSLSIRERNQ